ncbi:MAG: FecR domain-containing protein [Limisphaerales bacterium]
MKSTPQLLCTVLALFCGAALASAIPGRAEVKKVVGKASFTKAGSAPSTLSEGMVLGTGDTVITGAGSTVDLYLGLNGDYLRVDPDTTLKIDNLDIGNIAERTVTTQLSLGKGAITGNVVNKLTRASKYEIKSASGVAGIRGTVYSVKTDANGRITRIVVTTGTVTFIDRGVTITISAADGAKAYSPPPAGTTPTQALVGAATSVEAQVTSVIGVILERIQQGQMDSGAVGTVINNPLDVSISQ